MTKGFVIVAQNTKTVDYIKCATVLAESIKDKMPKAKVSLISDNKTNSKIFDSVIRFPHGDIVPHSDWKLVNDWQVYDASPYEHTIKLEADMWLPNNIDYWWDTLIQREVVVCTTIRDFKQNVSPVKAYRKFIEDNKLPDVYNGIVYFKKGFTAQKFFRIVRNVFENWTDWKNQYKCHPTEPVTTDWAYAIACHIVGVEKTTLPNFTQMSMVHMKQYINGLPTENWTDLLLYEILPHTLRINTYPQQYPFHYHIKNFAEKLEALYD